MSCPVCGRVLCDHSPDERGQSYEGMMADMDNDTRRIQGGGGLLGPATPFHPNSFNPRRDLPPGERPADWGLRD